MPTPEDRRTIADIQSYLDDGKAISHSEGVELLMAAQRLLQELDHNIPTSDAWTAANRALDKHWARIHRVEKLRDEWIRIGEQGDTAYRLLGQELTEAMADPDASEEQKLLQDILVKVVDRRDWAAQHALSQWQRYANAETVMNELLMESQGIEVDPYG